MSEIQLDLFNVSTTPLGVATQHAQPELPRLAQEIHDLVGPDGLVRIINRWGGTHMDFPALAKNFETSKIVIDLADEIGMGDAKRIAASFQGVRLHVPRCTAAILAVRDRDIRAKLDARIPAHVIARQYKMTERNVWLIAKKL